MKCRGDVDELPNIPLCDEDPNTELSSSLLTEQQLGQRDVKGTPQDVAAIPGYFSDPGLSEPHSKVVTQQHSTRGANEEHSGGMIDSQQSAADSRLTSGATWTGGDPHSHDDRLELLVGLSTAPMGEEACDAAGREKKK